MKRFTEVSLGRRRAELQSELYWARSDRTPTRRGMLFAVVADKLDLYSAERRLEKKYSFYCVLNQCTWCAYKTPLVLDKCMQLCICRFILIFGLSTLLHTGFWGILYSMLLGKMEVISRVVPFNRVLTFLEVVGLQDFPVSLLISRRFTDFDSSVIYHVLILCFCSFPL